MALFEDDPDLIRRQERQVREQAERARVMRQQIEAVQGVGNSPDNSVEVVVDSGGTLLGIGIEGVSNEVCEAIMSAYAAARRDAGEQVIADCHNSNIALLHGVLSSVDILRLQYVNALSFCLSIRCSSYVFELLENF